MPVSTGVKKDWRKLRFYSGNMGAGAVLHVWVEGHDGYVGFVDLSAGLALDVWRDRGSIVASCWL